jgi:hypothetical protein
MGKNDTAWETLFSIHPVLEEIDRTGFYEIEAKTIKAVREPRLMAKFDHQSNLPDIFKKNSLSILPVSRSKYVLGKFNAYESVSYNAQIEPKAIRLPSYITSIDVSNLYSESAALHCAYVTGMMEDLLGEQCLPTISGRMSSKTFEFDIEMADAHEHRIQIDHSQVEIDGGYESKNQLLLVEAKKERVDDFLIRQLYYPYRLWQGKTHKEVRPVFFTYSNDVFSFFVYEFVHPEKYNSLRLIEQRDYIIEHEKITFKDITELLHRKPTKAEPPVPFPQADSFARVVDLLGLLVENDLSKEEITTRYNFDSRQTNYYTAAGMYLGLLDRYEERELRTISFKLTDKGRRMMGMPYKEKYLSLASCILEHDVFKRVLHERVRTGRLPGRDVVIEMMKKCDLYKVGSESTYYRRSQTIIKWIDWIINLAQLEKHEEC